MAEITRAAESIQKIETLLGGLGTFGWYVIARKAPMAQAIFAVQLQVGARTTVQAEANTLAAAMTSAIRQVYERRVKEADARQATRDLP